MQPSFTVKAQEFEGPLEALLNMIEARKLSISEVNLASVCDSYLAYIESLPELPLGETSQFILVASTLLLIKSRSLLPLLELSREERESVEELERRLVRLAQVRKAARLLRKQWGTSPMLLPRAAPAQPIRFAPGEASLHALASAVARIIRTLPKPAALREAIVAPVRALDEVIGEVRDRLRRAARATFSDLTKTASREERIVYFLAMLELVRSGSASVAQETLFSDIMIEIEQTGIPKYGV